MFPITVEAAPGYKYVVDFSYELIANAFKSWFQTQVTDSELTRQWDPQKKRYFQKRVFQTKLVPLWREAPALTTDPCKVVIHRGHIEWLAWWIFKGPGSSMAIQFFAKDYVTSEKPFLKYPAGDHRVPVLHDKWRAVFDGHPRGEFYVEAQHLGFKSLVEYPSTAVNMGTGLGKTEIILAIVDHLVGKCVDHERPACQGNVIILVPGTAIRDGIMMRAERWDVEMHYNNFDPSNRINIVNPVGFMNSNNREDPKVLEWMANVEAVITDEAHKLSSDSASDFFTEIIPNVQRSMALSGSLDKVSGRYLHPTRIPVKEMSTASGWVTGYSGACRFDRKVAVDTHLTVISGDITEPHTYQNLLDREDLTGKEVSWMEKLDVLIASPRLPKFVKWVYDNRLKTKIENPKLYIPFSTKATGTILEEGLIAEGLRVCYWTSGTVRLNGEKVGSELADVVKLANSDAYDILLTSKVSYEGVDLPGLTAVMPLLGSNWSMIAQPIGRAARGNSLEIIMLLDTHNRYVTNTTSKRRDKVMEEYNIKSYQTIEWKFSNEGTGS